MKLPRARSVISAHRAVLIDGFRDVLFLAGLVAVVVAGFLTARPLGYLVLGAALVATSLVIEDPKEPKS